MTLNPGRHDYEYWVSCKITKTSMRKPFPGVCSSSGVRCSGAKRSKHRSGCPNASSGISMQTYEKSLRFFHVFLRQLTLPKPERSSRCALHMGIHPDSRRSTYFFVPFLFIVIEPGCYRSILFIIWLNCYQVVRAPHKK